MITKRLAALLLYLNAALFAGGAVGNVVQDTAADYGVAASVRAGRSEEQRDYDGFEGAAQGAVSVLSWMAAQSLIQARGAARSVSTLLRLPFPLDLDQYSLSPEQFEEIISRHKRPLLDLVRAQIPDSARELIKAEDLGFTYVEGHLDVGISFTVADLDRWLEVKELIIGKLVDLCKKLFMEKIQNIMERLAESSQVSDVVRAVIEEQRGRIEFRIERL